MHACKAVASGCAPIPGSKQGGGGHTSDCAAPTAARLERRLLSNVRYYDDFCLTHEDQRYMEQQYDLRPQQRDNYFVRTYPQVGGGQG